MSCNPVCIYGMLVFQDQTSANHINKIRIQDTYSMSPSAEIDFISTSYDKLYHEDKILLNRRTNKLLQNYADSVPPVL